MRSMTIDPQILIAHTDLLIDLGHSFSFWAYISTDLSLFRNRITMSRENSQAKRSHKSQEVKTVHEEFDLLLFTFRPKVQIELVWQKFRLYKNLIVLLRFRFIRCFRDYFLFCYILFYNFYAKNI